MAFSFFFILNHVTFSLYAYNINCTSDLVGNNITLHKRDLAAAALDTVSADDADAIFRVEW